MGELGLHVVFQPLRYHPLRWMRFLQQVVEELTRRGTVDRIRLVDIVGMRHTRRCYWRSRP